MSKSKYKIEVVKSATDGQWFWRLKNTRGGRPLRPKSSPRRSNVLRTVNPLAAALQCPVFVLRKPE